MRLIYCSESREITKMYKLPKKQRGLFGKKVQKAGKKWGHKTQELVAKIRNLQNSCEIFATLQNLQCFEFFHFLLQFPSDF